MNKWKFPDLVPFYLASRVHLLEHHSYIDARHLHKKGISFKFRGFQLELFCLPSQKRDVIEISAGIALFWLFFSCNCFVLTFFPSTMLTFFSHRVSCTAEMLSPPPPARIIYVKKKNESGLWTFTIYKNIDIYTSPLFHRTFQAPIWVALESKTW